MEDPVLKDALGKIEVGFPNLEISTEVLSGERAQFEFSHAEKTYHINIWKGDLSALEGKTDEKPYKILFSTKEGDTLAMLNNLNHSCTEKTFSQGLIKSIKKIISGNS